MLDMALEKTANRRRKLDAVVRSAFQSGSGAMNIAHSLSQKLKCLSSMVDRLFKMLGSLLRIFLIETYRGELLFHRVEDPKMFKSRIDLCSK